MKAAGINVSEMNALQTDLIKQGVQGNLQEVQPEELSPAQKQQFKQLQQESDPAIPTGLLPLSTPPQTGTIRTPYLPEPPRTLTSLESPKANTGPAAWNRD